MPTGELGAYLLLALTAFGAASVLPFASEPLLIAMLLSSYDPLALWAVASVGNTAGAVLNWWLAGHALRWRHERWFPFRGESLTRATGWFQRYGQWTLLLAWAPLVGDALTFVAGLLRVRLSVFLLLVGVGKAARYAVVVWPLS